MYSLTTIIVGEGIDYRVVDGALIRLPPELQAKHLLDQYVARSKSGWSASEFGYWCYARQVDGVNYIVPGLIISGRSKPRKKFPGYLVEFTEVQIENYVDGIIELISEVRQRAEQDLNMLVHDLRQLSGAIYHAAEEGKNLLKSGDLTSAEIRFDNIIASQAMLRIRADVLDFAGNPDVSFGVVSVPIFRRVDKVVRSFMPYAIKKRVSIRLEGPSFQFGKGPDVFEIIPYVLVDNAIKYSPANEEIKVRVQDNGAFTEIRVESVGPRIEREEIDRIFDKGYRGINARASGRPGSGIGLHLARSLVARFSGSIGCDLGQVNYQIGGAPMTDICFWVRVPSSV